MNKGYSNPLLTSIEVMPSCTEKSRARVKKWKQENPDLYKEQRKRYRKKHAEKCKQNLNKWRKENSDLRKGQKARERENTRKKKTLGPRNQQRPSALECTGETDAIVETQLTNINFDQPLNVIDFDIEEVLDCPKQVKSWKNSDYTSASRCVHFDFDLSFDC